MDAEGLGRKLRLTPLLSGDPRRSPKKQTAGTVTASHKMLTLQALSSSLHAGTAKRGWQCRGKALGDLRQSVPQNGRVHLHVVDLNLSLTPQPLKGECLSLNSVVLRPLMDGILGNKLAWGAKRCIAGPQCFGALAAP